MNKDLLIAKKSIYDYCNFEYSTEKVEPQNSAYFGHSFKINNKTVQFRVAKITPKKAGLFVTLYKRPKNSPIKPYDVSDNIDLVVIQITNNNNWGQFIFPQAILLKKNIISIHNTGGKRGFRIYPPWEIVTSKQAQQTQKWQSKFFLTIEKNNFANCQQARVLYLIRLMNKK